MTGSRRPWAMNTRRSGAAARSGSQPSTTGMNPEKARMPGRDRAVPVQAERVAHHRAHREAAEDRGSGADAGPLPLLVVERRELRVGARGRCRDRGSRRAARRTSGCRASREWSAARAASRRAAGAADRGCPQARAGRARRHRGRDAGRAGRRRHRRPGARGRRARSSADLRARVGQGREDLLELGAQVLVLPGSRSSSPRCSGSSSTAKPGDVVAISNRIPCGCRK